MQRLLCNKMPAVKADLYRIPGSVHLREIKWKDESHKEWRDIMLSILTLRTDSIFLCLMLQSFKSLVCFATLTVHHLCILLFWEVQSMAVRNFRVSCEVSNCWEPLGADVEPQAQTWHFFKIWDFFIKKSAYVKCLFFPYLFSGLLLWKIFLKGSTIQTVHHLICLFSKAGWIC